MTKKPTCDLCKKPVNGNVYYDRVLRYSVDADYMISTDGEHRAHKVCLIKLATTQLKWE